MFAYHVQSTINSMEMSAARVDERRDEVRSTVMCVYSALCYAVGMPVNVTSNDAAGDEYDPSRLLKAVYYHHYLMNSIESEAGRRRLKEKQ